MTTIDKNCSPTLKEVESFLMEIGFKLPIGFIEFFRDANGANISSETRYVILWPLTDMLHLNKQYNVDEYAPEFFIFGSDGGDTAYVIEKATSHIFEMPFIGMSKKEAIFICKFFDEFLKNI